MSVLVVNELEPLHERFKELNEMVGEAVVGFGGMGFRQGM